MAIPARPLESDRVVQSITTGGDPIGVASDGNRLWVSFNSDELVLRIPEHR